MADAPIIILFRQDLRIADNPALASAAAAGQPVVPVYVLDDEAAGAWAAGGASRWWLHHSLVSLSLSLERLGAPLVLRRGRTVDALLALARETGARTIHLTRAYEPFAARLEQDLEARARTASIAVRRFAGSLLAEPEALRTKDGRPFRVFTPFWRALQASVNLPPLATTPRRLTPVATRPRSDDLASWRLLPTRPDWAGGLRAEWQPGETGAAKRLDAFLGTGLEGYATQRDRPDIAGTSQLSPYLHFGEVSPRQCWHALDAARQREPSVAAGAASFLRELGWREFSVHLLHNWPSIPEAPFRAQFADFPWEPDAALRRELFAAWSRGRTGYPIVDAGMRQLWETGWMHNRVRMITASFLTKHLLIPWQDGARWFWDTLVDADLANNSASWQWVAGSGADAAPYFRVFNPVLQGLKFDPDGAYVRRFVPELARLADKDLHAPWMANDDALARAGVTLGKTYPRPIVDHDFGRRRALEAFATIKTDAPAPDAA